MTEKTEDLIAETWEERRTRLGWPTPNHMRKAADALSVLSVADYAGILRYVADLCDGLLSEGAPSEGEEHFHIWSENPCKPGECRMSVPSPDREKLITEAYNVVTGDGGIATPEDALDALNRLYDAAALAAQPVLDAEADLRDVAHISCDCVPDLGPEHCHLCSDREGHEVTWTECSSHLLDPERARTWLQREFGSVLAHDPHNPERFWGGAARALCEAAERGELNADR